MTTASNNKKNWVDMYDGFDSRVVGAGVIDPTIYSDPQYAKKKTQTLLIGGMNLITYGGFEHDTAPLIITIGYEPTYNTILAYNLHYVPEGVRKQIIEFIIKTNIRRIKKGQPMIIDYHQLKKAIPVSTMIVRRYKVVLIRVVDTPPLKSWRALIKGGNKWSSHHKNVSKSESDSIMKRFSRSVSNFFR